MYPTIQIPSPPLSPEVQAWKERAQQGKMLLGVYCCPQARWDTDGYRVCPAGCDPDTTVLDLLTAHGLGELAHIYIWETTGEWYE